MQTISLLIGLALLVSSLVIIYQLTKQRKELLMDIETLKVTKKKKAKKKATKKNK